MKRLRYWIINKLFTESEKYLMMFACNNRINQITELSIMEKTVDFDNIMDDIKEIVLIKRRIFSTNLYN
jgi:hypothetical protein